MTNHLMLAAQQQVSVISENYNHPSSTILWRKGGYNFLLLVIGGYNLIFQSGGLIIPAQCNKAFDTGIE